MIKKLLTLVTTISLVLFATAPAYAAPAATNSSKCGDTKTQLIACDAKTGVGTINSLISITISVLTVIIGIVATGALAYAGIIYASAEDNQSKVSEARGLIRNVIIGLLLYALTIAIINWLIPGGIIGGGSTDSSGGSAEQTVSPSPSTSTNPGTVTPGTQ